MSGERLEEVINPMLSMGENVFQLHLLSAFVMTKCGLLYQMHRRCIVEQIEVAMHSGLFKSIVDWPEEYIRMIRQMKYSGLINITA